MKLGSRHLAPFLALGVLLLLMACARAAPTPTPTTAPPTATPTTAPVVGAATATPTRVVAVAPTPTPIRAPATPTPTAKREPRGTLNIIDAVGNELWLLRHSTSESPMWYISEPLLWWDWEKDSPTNEAILESWDVKQNTDGSQDFTLKIRKGVKFHKGWGDVKAEDVKFSLVDFLKPGSVNANTARLTNWFGKDPNNMTVVDDYTLRIHQPKVQSLIELLRVASAEEPRTLRPFPKKYYEQVGEEQFPRNPIYAGPYEFVSQQRGYDIRLKAVPDFYRVTPGFAELHYVKVLEEATKIAMLRSGQVDIATVPARYLGELKAAGVRVAVSEYGQEPFIAFGGLFPDRPKCDPTVPWAGGCKGEQMLAENPTKIRKAFNLALDRQAIVDKILFGSGGVGVISFSFLSPKFQWWSPEWKPLPYDPKQAKQLLAEAGYPNCFEFKMWQIVGQDPYSQDIGEVAASTWEQTLGCKVNRRAGEYQPTLRTMLIERNTSGWLYTFSGGPLARPFRYACLHGGPNYEVITHTELPFYSEICPKIERALDIAEQVKLEQQIGDLEYKYFPTVAVGFVHATYGVGPKVKEWTPMPKKTNAGLLEYAQPK
ncbi:MAG: ABC transporter substrate-binding protein [Chloroflexi bacterium]|nr:ABC transporter substrate-binding protein [Chloroflexota bacterium]